MESIETIVQVALDNGYLPPALEKTISQAYDCAFPLSLHDLLALDRLMEAILAGQVRVIPHKQFINVMEEFVLIETTAQLQVVEAHKGPSLDFGDIAAYALNRLPPLYATSKEGASFQRTHAQKELRALIAQQVEEAINRNLAKPEFFPHRQALLGRDSWQGESVVEQIIALLRTRAPGLKEQAGLNPFDSDLLDCCYGRNSLRPTCKIKSR